jgi:hypothetical protein
MDGRQPAVADRCAGAPSATSPDTPATGTRSRTGNGMTKTVHGMPEFRIPDKRFGPRAGASDGG